MNKSKLKTGMKVKTKNGFQFVVVLNTPWGDGLVGNSTLNGISLDEFRDDLRNKEDPKLDIVEVYSNWRMTNIELNDIDLPGYGYCLVEKINS